MNPTLASLAQFPDVLAAHYELIPRTYRHWAPASWDGIPSEHFTALEQVCHVRDIENEGYRSRLERTLAEDNPYLASIDSYAMAQERRYAAADADAALRTFREARHRTVDLLAGLTPAQLSRPAVFEGYGPTSLRGLMHYLCSHDQQHLAGMQWLLGKLAASGDS